MMQKIPKREYTVEFKEQAVKRVKDGKSVGAVAKEMGLSKGLLGGIIPDQIEFSS